MRYYLIDRILQIDRYSQIIAIKNVALSEDIFVDHFVGFPVMPGAMQIESLAQAGTMLLEVSADFKKKALLVIIDQAKFRVLVRPGDQLLVTMNTISISSESAQLDGEIHVNDKLVTNARLTFALKAAEEFYLPKAKNLIEIAYNALLKEAKMIGF
jgi:3-hydroxyacyl-[acyl-carrier-protein] dehydratase